MNIFIGFLFFVGLIYNAFVLNISPDAHGLFCAIAGDCILFLIGIHQYCFHLRTKQEKQNQINRQREITLHIRREILLMEKMGRIRDTNKKLKSVGYALAEAKIKSVMSRYEMDQRAIQNNQKIVTTGHIPDPDIRMHMRRMMN